MMTYIEHADDVFTTKNNIISMSAGMIGFKCWSSPKKYYNGHIIDLFDGCTEVCNGYVPLIRKYTERIGTQTGGDFGGCSGCSGTYDYSGVSGAIQFKILI